MAEITHGTVLVTVPDSIAPPSKAGKMTEQEVKRLLRAPQGMGLASQEAASSFERAGPGFVAPVELSPEVLRELGARSEEIAQVVRDLELVLGIAKQASLLFDYEAYEKLRQLNDLVKAQAKYRPELYAIFSSLLEFFAKAAKTRKENRRKKEKEAKAQEVKKEEATSQATPQDAAPQAA